MIVPKFLFTHKNHVVKCDNCKCPIVRIASSRYRTEENKKIIIYQCLNCGKKFTCCAKKHDYHKVSNIRKLITHHKREIKRLEGLIQHVYH